MLIIYFIQVVCRETWLNYRLFNKTLCFAVDSISDEMKMFPNK